MGNQTNRLGRSGLHISRLCLGTYNFGSVTDKDTAFQIMDTALDAGISFFDTADQYPASPKSFCRSTRC